MHTKQSICMALQVAVVRHLTSQHAYTALPAEVKRALCTESVQRELEESNAMAKHYVEEQYVKDSRGQPTASHGRGTLHLAAHTVGITSVVMSGEALLLCHLSLHCSLQLATTVCAASRALPGSELGGLL